MLKHNGFNNLAGAAVALVVVSSILTLRGSQAAGGQVAIQPVDPAALNAVCRQRTSDHSPTSRQETGTLYTVPAGKRLVIETVSGRASVNSGTRIRATLHTRSGGFLMPTELIFESQGADGPETRWAFTHSVRLYADAGTNVDFTFIRNSSESQGSKSYSFSGYLIDKP